MSLDPITALLDIGRTALDKFVANPQAKAEALFKLQELAAKQDSEQLQAQVQLIIAQTEINKIEASSSDRFVSGWRPYIGWICGSALGYQFLVEPFMRFIAQVCFKYSGNFPVLQMDELTTILLGLLGLGVMRTVEKVKGVN